MTWKAVLARARSLRRGRTVALLALAAVLAAGAVAVAVSGRRTRDAAASTDARTPTPMPGMPGIEMPGMEIGDGAVRLTSEQLQTFGVSFSTVDQRPLSAEVRTVGVVTFDERRLAEVAPKFSGFVERLYVNYTGQPVRRGQPLLDVYSPELVAAQHELLVARELERTGSASSVPGVPQREISLVQAARQRLRLWDISDAQIDEVLRTGRVRRALTLYSPTAGTVIEKNVVAGQAVAAGQTLYTIADLRSMWVDAELREQDAGGVRIGSPAEIELSSFPGREFSGRVSYFYPTVGEAARTVKARIEVANPGGVLLPGMYATVTIRTPIRTALTIPASAAINTGRRTIVFVDMGSGRLMPHDVVLGRASAGYAEVISGLEPRQRVVTSAQFLLDSESNLGEVMRAMIGQMGASDMAPRR
jgi:Cu(I)/Ag(I) efflux system membrane fusion protein